MIFRIDKFNETICNYYNNSCVYGRNPRKCAKKFVAVAKHSLYVAAISMFLVDMAILIVSSRSFLKIDNAITISNYFSFFNNVCHNSTAFPI